MKNKKDREIDTVRNLHIIYIFMVYFLYRMYDALKS